MHLSAKCDYALRALFHLAGLEDGGHASIREIAQENDIPRRFLEHIMIDLREQGWVRSIPGRHGGYELARAPSSITLGDVVRHFDGVLAPVPCASVTKYEPCAQEAACRFRHLMVEIRNFAANLMDHETLGGAIPTPRKPKGRRKPKW